MTNLVSLIDDDLLTPGDIDARYANSPFVHLKQLHAKQKGKRYELITECVLKKCGFDIKKRTSTDHDRVINGMKCEIKGSTLNNNTDHFSFLQIRAKQDYDMLVFSMFYPERLVIMQMPKNIVQTNIDNGTFKKQHGGNRGSSDTYMYYGEEHSLAAIGAQYL